MLISRLNCSFRRTTCFAIGNVVAPFYICRSTSSTKQAPTEAVNASNRRPLESLNVNQVTGLFKQLGFALDIVNEQGLNGVVLATAVESAKDLEQLGLKPLQARALLSLITEWKAFGVLTEQHDGIERIVPVAAKSTWNAETSIAPKLSIEYGRREAMNSDYYLSRCSDAAASDRIQQSANSGDLLAQAYLALLCHHGTAQIGRDVELAKGYALLSWSWLEENAALGCPFSQFTMGFCCVKNLCSLLDRVEGMHLLAEAAKFNHLGAINLLGYCCVAELVKKDFQAAAKYYKKAADMGDAEGQVNFGKCLSVGTGVTKDYKEAAKYFKLAADQGYAYGQCGLAVCYLEGAGVVKDEQEALKYCKLATDQGFPEALCLMASFYANGFGVAKDEEEAVKCILRAADQGFDEAQFILGVSYEEGRGVTKDDQEAVRYFKLAAEKSHVDAQSRLGECYMKGVGVARDSQKAMHFYKLAAEQGDVGALFHLGVYNKDVFGVTKKYQQPPTNFYWHR